MKKVFIWMFFSVVLVLLSGCEFTAEEESPVNSQSDAVDYITEDEAEIYFYEITSSYRFELMCDGVESAKNGVDPIYWKGAAPEKGEFEFSQLTDEYTSEEDRSFLSNTYGTDINYKTFAVYSITELQQGFDSLFGAGAVDITQWNPDNVDVVNTKVFTSVPGYILGTIGEDEKFDNQIYKIIDVKGGKGEAVVRAYAVSVDSITTSEVRDLGTIEETDEENSSETYGKKIDSADISKFDFGLDFSGNMSAMGIDESSLGVVEFTFGVKGISLYLKELKQGV